MKAFVYDLARTRLSKAEAGRKTRAASACVMAYKSLLELARN
jgi:hypothetical protein